MQVLSTSQIVRQLTEAGDLARALRTILRDPERADLDLARQICADVEDSIASLSRDIEASAPGGVRDRIGRIPPPGGAIP